MHEDRLKVLIAGAGTLEDLIDRQKKALETRALNFYQKVSPSAGVID